MTRVVAFPNSPRVRATTETLESARAQEDLFFKEHGYRGVLASLNLDECDQGQLFRLFALLPVKCVVDVRMDAVFRKPSFFHSEVIAHFQNRKVKYIYANDIVSSDNIHTRLQRGEHLAAMSGEQRQIMRKLISWGLFHGLTVIIYSASDPAEIYELTRAEILSHPEFRAELPNKMVLRLR